MREEERVLAFGGDSIPFGSLLCGNYHAPEDSNRIFKNYQIYENREIRRTQQPSKSTHATVMIQEVSVMAMKQIRYVNSKQWERMLKRRIKRQMEKLKNLSSASFEENLQGRITQIKPIKKYKYQSRHIHAEKRVRNEKGRFISTRPKPVEGAVKGKKKRGRKSKKQREEIRLAKLRQAQELSNPEQTSQQIKENQPTEAQTVRKEHCAVEDLRFDYHILPATQL